MRKYVVLITFLILAFPNTINAKERLEVSCNKIEIKANEETECKIIAKELDFVITGISAKLKVSENINILSSNYNHEKWMMLDDEFNIEDINLINEKPIKEKNIEIASFIIKSNSNKKLEENIILEDLLIGDQKYEKRKIDVKNETIYINKKKNSNKNFIIYISSILIGLILVFCIMKCKKKVSRGAV